jgi:SdpI/YhfL family protein
MCSTLPSSQSSQVIRSTIAFAAPLLAIPDCRTSPSKRQASDDFAACTDRCAIDSFLFAQRSTMKPNLVARRHTAGRTPEGIGAAAMAGWIGVVVPGAIGVVFVLLGVPLAQRRIGRNTWYGYRLRTTLRDDDVWYPVNERGGRHLVVLGSSQIVVALIGLFFTGNDDTQRDLLYLGLAITVAGLAYSTWTCYTFARDLDHSKRLSSGGT